MIARVFARRTNDCPTDDLAFFSSPDLWEKRQFDKIMVSCSFTYDKSRAELLAEEWRGLGPIEVGGPAYGTPSGEFTSGMFLRKGITITSRGCPNRCWFCSVWKREGGIRELPIVEGNEVFDDNLLACSETHIKSVFGMLKNQRAITFRGGIEAKLLKDWHIDELMGLKLASSGALYMAYDTPDDLDPLKVAIKKMTEAGIKRRQMCVYCLIGGPKDTKEKATERLDTIIRLGGWPFAMLWRDEDGYRNESFVSLQREYTNPWIVATKIKEFKP